MPKTVLLDEWHLTFRIAALMSDADVRAVRRVLKGKAFTAAARPAILTVLTKHPALKPVRVTISR